MTDQSKSATQPATPPIVVVWQSLVVAGYRSFFYELQRVWPANIYLIAPISFTELGSQERDCEPFNPDAPIPTERCFSLQTLTKHTQVVYYRGLSSVLRKIRRREETPPLVLCLAEPYSATALLALVQSRLALGRGSSFFPFALQNLNKQFPAPLRLIEQLIYKCSRAILSLGSEQTMVLRQRGFTGSLIDFPLWFDSKQFNTRLTPRLAKQHLAAKSPISGSLERVRGPAVGFCGSMIQEKGVFDLLNLWEGSPALQHDFQLILAGTGRDNSHVLNIFLRLQAAGASVLHLGGLTLDDMRAFYGLVDVLVVPSRTAAHWKEQFGRVIVEAQACGTVAVGSDSGEIPTVIGNPDRIFAEGDLTAMEKTIRKSMSLLPEQRDAIKRENHSRYSDQECARRFAARLRRTLGIEGGTDQSGELSTQSRAPHRPLLRVVPGGPHVGPASRGLPTEPSPPPSKLH